MWRNLHKMDVKNYGGKSKLFMAASRSIYQKRDDKSIIHEELVWYKRSSYICVYIIQIIGRVINIYDNDNNDIRSACFWMIFSQYSISWIAVVTSSSNVIFMAWEQHRKSHLHIKWCFNFRWLESLDNRIENNSWCFV